MIVKKYLRVVILIIMKAFAARNLLASIFLLTIIKATYIKDIDLTYEYMNADFLERENPQIYNPNALNNIKMYCINQRYILTPELLMKKSN